MADRTQTETLFKAQGADGEKERRRLEKKPQATVGVERNLFLSTREPLTRTRTSVSKTVASTQTVKRGRQARRPATDSQILGHDFARVIGDLVLSDREAEVGVGGSALDERQAWLEVEG